MEHSESKTHSQRKVNVGVKCAPDVKYTLVNEALKLGISVSEYVELIILNRKTSTDKQLSILKRKVDFYENGFLKSEFEKLRGQEVKYIDENDREIWKVIKSIEDVYTILIKSIEYKQHV